MKGKLWKNETPGDSRLPGLRFVRQGAAALRRMSKGAQVLIVALFTCEANVAWSGLIFMMGVIIRRNARLHKR